MGEKHMFGRYVASDKKMNETEKVQSDLIVWQISLYFKSNFNCEMYADYVCLFESNGNQYIITCHMFMFVQ